MVLARDVLSGDTAVQGFVLPSYNYLISLRYVSVLEVSLVLLHRSERSASFFIFSSGLVH